MSDTDTARDGIASAVQDYFDGMMYGDETRLRRAFHGDAFIIGHFQDELEWLSLDAFTEFCQQERQLADGDPYEARIESIEVTGDAAVAKVANLYLGIWFTDYLSLLERDGSWRIVNKVFFAHPQE